MFNTRNVILFAAACWLAVIIAVRPWKENIIINDVVNYYGYLPAAIIYHDLTLDFVKNDPDFFYRKYWPETAANGGKVIRMTMGISYLYLPFFLTGHLLAGILAEPQTGFSWPYQCCVLFGCLFYLVIGLIFLARILKRFFSEKISALVILCVFGGTNLFCYSTIDGLMSHGFIFSLMCTMLYYTIKWHEQPERKNSIKLGLLLGLLTLIRPIHVSLILIPFLYGVNNWKGLGDKLKMLKSNYKYLVIVIICFLIPGIPQLIYWKYNSGQWFFYSYGKERFFFDHPHFIDGIFGFRKGWLVYTPVMVFALIGFYFMKRFAKDFFISSILAFALGSYMILSWWCWWYGGSFGQRSMIDFYGLLALPMGSFFSYVTEKKKVVSISIYTVVTLLIALNFFQTWQYYNQFIHFDSMTREAYVEGFFKTEHTYKWYKVLEEPEYERVLLGIPEKYSKEEICDQGNKKISLRADNYQFICSEINKTGELAANRENVGDWEKFNLVNFGDQKVALQAYSGKYASVNDSTSLLQAVKDSVSAECIFTLNYSGNNRITLKDRNGNYIVRREDSGNLLYANEKNETSFGVFKLTIYY